MPRPPRFSARVLTAALVGMSGFTATVIATDTVASSAPAPAPAVAGTWGPDAVPYRNGVVCHTATATTRWSRGPSRTLPALRSRWARSSVPPPGRPAAPTNRRPATRSSIRSAPAATDSPPLRSAPWHTCAAMHGSDTQPDVVGDVAAAVGEPALPKPDGASLPRPARQRAGPGHRGGAVDDCHPTGRAVHGAPDIRAAAADPRPARHLTATVTAASGAPVPGMSVTLSTVGAPVQSITGADGAVTAPLTVPKGQPRPLSPRPPPLPRRWA